MSSVQAKKPPLEGIRVLDLGHYIAGPLAGMLLADQGAEVIKIDPPTGPAFDHPVNAVLGRGKKSLRLDLKNAQNAESISVLIKSADVLIENFSPGVMERLGLGSTRLKTLNPNLICLSLPGFGEDEPLAKDAKAYEGIIAAVTGQYTNIHAVRELFGLDPVYTNLPLASVYAAVHGATGVVLGLRHRALKDRAPHITAPLANAAMSAMSSIFLDIELQSERYAVPRLPKVLKNLVLPVMRRWAKTGERAQGKLLNIARKSYLAFMTSYTCEDGALLYLFAIDNPKLVRSALQTLGLLEAVKAEGLVFADPYTAGDLRNNLSETGNLARAHQTKLKSMIADVLAGAPATQWEERFTAAGVPCAINRPTTDWLQTPELLEAGIVTSFDLPDGRTMLQPGIQAWLSDTPEELAHPSPGQAYTSVDPITGATTQSSSCKVEAASSWLTGLTVIDMCSMVAGPVAGRTLAEYGARVIKVETPRPNHGPRMTCWYGVDGNRGKESILIDLSTTGGKHAMRALLSKADILLTNHMPAAMDKLGFGETEVRRVNPSMLYVRIGAYNGPLGGPWFNRNGYDPVLQAASGIMHRYGDPGHPELHAIASCVDALTGYSAVFGIALGLYRNTQSTASRTVNTSLAAAAALIQLPFAHTLPLPSQNEGGQNAKGKGALYRLYQARDGWIFLAAPHAKMKDLPSQLQAKSDLYSDRLEAHLESVCAKHTVKVLVKLLTTAGLSAARVQNVERLSRHLLDRPDASALRLVKHQIDGLGSVTTVPAQQIFADGSLRQLQAAEKPGASTKSILQELGLPAQTLLRNGAAAEEISDDYLPR